MKIGCCKPSLGFQHPHGGLWILGLLLLGLVSEQRVSSFPTPLSVATTPRTTPRRFILCAAQQQDKQEKNGTTTASSSTSVKENSAMQFLKKIGRVGKIQDFTHAIGVDEGSEGESAVRGKQLRKTVSAYPVLSGSSGMIDALTEPFPFTSLGTVWSGYTDQVMGGQSMGLLERHTDFHGRTCNVLRGTVRSLPGRPDAFGFVQMATNLVLNPDGDTARATATADASSFEGVELQVLYEGETPNEQFNVHLKTPDCLAPQASYRATFTLPTPNTWHDLQIPWSDFSGKGPGANTTPLNPSQLMRAGIVAIGKEMPHLVLGMSRFALYQTQPEEDKK